jgi:hypothetical protein
MNLVKAIIAAFLGLFLDDGRFAAAILAWLFSAWLILPRLALPRGLPALLFCAGLAGILILSAGRAARRR